MINDNTNNLQNRFNLQQQITKQKMRPIPAKNRLLKSQQKNKDQTQFITIKKLRSNLDSPRYYRSSQQQLKITQKMQKFKQVKILKNPKTLGLVEAYMPSQLTQYMLKSAKSNNKFQAKQKNCNLNEIFLKSIINHFRKWKLKIETKLTSIIDLLELQQLLNQKAEEKVMSVIQELYSYSKNLKQSLEQLIDAKQQLLKIYKLHQKYIKLQKMTHHTIILVDCIYRLIKQVNYYLRQNRNNTKDKKKIEQSITVITTKYEQQASESLLYCASNYDSQILLKLEYRVKYVLMFMHKRIHNICESNKQIQILEKSFEEKMGKIEKYNNFTLQDLQLILDILYSKNQQIKIAEKKYFMDEDVEFSTLRSKIQEQETKFIKKLRTKTIKIIEQYINLINQMRTVHLIKSREKYFQQMKKKWLILIKIYQQSLRENNMNSLEYQNQQKLVKHYIDHLTAVVKNVSAPIQEISIQIELLEKLRGKQTAIRELKSIQSFADVVKSIQKLKSQIWKYSFNLYEALCKAENQPTNTIEESISTDGVIMDKYYQLIFYSRTEEKNIDINELLIDSENSNQLRVPKIEEILTNYQAKNLLHQKITKNDLEIGVYKYFQLKQCSQNQIIVYLFNNDFTAEFISNYPYLTNINTINSKILASVERLEINGIFFNIINKNMFDQYRAKINEEIRKLEKSKFKSIFNKYIIFLYENTLLEILNTKKIYELSKNKQKNTEGTQYQKYHNIFQNFIGIYQNILQKIAKENSPFGFLLSMINDISQMCSKESKLISQFQNSINTGQYYPSISLMTKLIQFYYSFHIEQSINKVIFTNEVEYVKTIFTQSIKKLQILRQKVKVSQNFNSKMYKKLCSMISMLKQFTFNQEYEMFLMKIITFLQALQIQHEAIFTKDEQPIFVFPKIRQRQEIKRLIFQKLHIENKTINLKEFLVLFNLNISKAIVMANNKQIGVKKAQKNNKRLNNNQYDQVIEEMDLQLQVQSNIQQVVNQILHPNSQQFIETYQSYYKIIAFDNISKLKKCIKNRNNQFENIKQKLKTEILFQIYRYPQSKQIIIKHISDVLKQIHQHDMMRALNIDHTISECQQKLILFQQKLRYNNANLNEQFLHLLEYFRFTKKIIYIKGNNIIETISKDCQQLEYLHINLTENSFKKELSYFRIKDIQNIIWAQISTFQSKNQQISPTFLLDLNKSIDQSNKIILELYKTIEREINILSKIKSQNKIQSQKKIEEFLEKVINYNFLLPQFKNPVSNIQGLLKLISVLANQMSNLKVVQPFYTFTLSNQQLFLSEMNISNQAINKYLQLPQQFQLTLSNQSDKRININRQTIRSFLKLKTSIDKLDYSNVEEFIISKQKLINEKKKRQIIINQVNSFSKYLSIFDNKSELFSTVSQIRHSVTLLECLMKGQAENKIHLQEFSLNQNIKYIQSQNCPNFKYLDTQFLKIIIKQLDNIKISYCTVQLNSKPILLAQNLEYSKISKKMSISAKNVSILQKNSLLSNNKIIINKLFITISQIIPQVSKIDLQIKKRIDQFLSKTTIQIRSEENHGSYNCLDILNSKNLVQLPVAWPKSEITCRIFNAEFKSSLNISPHQYQYYSQISLVIFHNLLKKKYQQISEDYKKEHKQQTQLLKRQEVQKQQQANQLKKKQMQKQIDFLKMEQEKARIRFETQQICRKIRENQMEQNARRIQNENREKAKIEQNQKMMKVKANKKPQARKLVKSKSCMGEFLIKKQKNFREQFYQVDLILSDGEDDRYVPAETLKIAVSTKYTKQHTNKFQSKNSSIIQALNKTTLYHQIKETYYKRRQLKQPEAKKWIKASQLKSKLMKQA